jgi:hypothetical protein
LEGPIVHFVCWEVEGANQLQAEVFAPPSIHRLVYAHIEIHLVEEVANISYFLVWGENIEDVLEILTHRVVLQLDYIHELFHPEADQE